MNWSPVTAAFFSVLVTLGFAMLVLWDKLETGRSCPEGYVLAGPNTDRVDHLSNTIHRRQCA